MSSRGLELERRLASRAPFLLDGATGTELERRGVSTTLPLWSAPVLLEQPELVAAIHAEYVSAGVDAITANTFRTQRHCLERGGLADRAGSLTHTAVELARRATGSADRDVFVLGSSAPLEDCYRPDRVPDDAVLEAEHAAHSRALVRAGVDAILAETMGTIREALAATRAACDAGAAVLVSFVCWDGARLLSGEPLDEAVEAVASLGPIAVAVNCLPPSNVAACCDVLADQSLPFGLYPNLGAPDDALGFRRSEEIPPEAFAREAEAWRRSGATLIGGCCGTTPAHLAAVRRLGLE